MVDATEFIVRQITLTLDTDEGMHNAVTAAALNAASQEAERLYETNQDYGSARGMYEAILYGGTEPADAVSNTRGWYRDAVGEVGEAVANAIGEHVDEALADAPEHIRGMITSILDLYGWETRWALGVHYLPEDADDVYDYPVLGEDN